MGELVFSAAGPSLLSESCCRSFDLKGVFADRIVEVTHNGRLAQFQHGLGFHLHLLDDGITSSNTLPRSLFMRAKRGKLHVNVQSETAFAFRRYLAVNVG